MRILDVGETPLHTHSLQGLYALSKQVTYRGGTNAQVWLSFLCKILS